VSPNLSRTPEAGRSDQRAADGCGRHDDGRQCDSALSQPDGTALEIKTFDAHDGQVLPLAQTAGLRTGCITGRDSAALLRRAHEMKMEFIHI